MRIEARKQKEVKAAFYAIVEREFKNLRVTNGLEEEMRKGASENEERAYRWGEREQGGECGSREVSRTHVTEGNVRTGQWIELKRASICLGARSCP